ncbi:HlyD family type I secretion periplasmic adaptor subunit [Falsihalocynthiibacter sp. SS001]|uniref:HlyD family type I secretion periplasmic adaptor subunit n=1 Tax=Falsihalocynthiibacter sp. SS001 TaxID=3349698 RepID=UPI0036D2AEAB
MSKNNWELRDFATGSQAANLGRSSRLLTVLLLVLVALFVAGITWASVARIEEMARATGRVVPSGKARTVESFEGGIVREILVSEGDIVEKDQVLVRMDDIGSGSSLGEYEAQQKALQIRNLRLEAERANLDEFDLSDSDFDPDDPIVVREVALFDSRRASYFGQRAVLEAQQQQRQQESDELRAALVRVNENLALLEEEIDLKTQSGVIPRTQIIPLEREKSARTQERDALEFRLNQAIAAIQEADARLQEAALERRAQISLERSETLNQLNVIDQTVKRASDVVVRAALRSPVRGIVSVLNVNTLGAVVAPGEEVLRIVPANDQLQVEARVRPEDIAFVRPGLGAKVKLTSFDFTVYGSLEGQVVRVGADAEQDEATGEIYFPVIVETEKNMLEHNGEVLEIRPGMVASLDILTGERTILDYLLKPFRKAQLEAMRER